MKEITITEGLCELKTYTNRINSAINNMVFIGCHQGNKAVAGYNSNEDFSSFVKKDFDRVKSLIEERNKLKAAIVNSNATTKVSIGSKEYTVAEAIERKSSIQFEKDLLTKMIQQAHSVIQSMDSANRMNQAKLDQLILNTFGKDAKVNSEEIGNLTKSYNDTNEIKVCDPLNVKEVANKLAEDIDNFLKEVDIKLSISNATTKIEV